MADILNVRRADDFSYPILFEKSFEKLSEAITEAGLAGRRCCIVCDTNTGRLYAEAVRKEISRVCKDVACFSFQAGEEQKNLDTISAIYGHLIQAGMDRTGFLAALGGGVVGDMTGFAAATYLRGVDFIQIPTTLLSQVDSSVGGKTGVDYREFKNMVGAFYQPRCVYMNMSTLKTLPAVEFTSGMGEVLKTGLICDGDFFRRTVKSYDALTAFDMDALASVVRRCCEIKAGIVERDPREQGERALLNLGHTVGHAVEKLLHFELRHGQCVGIGLAFAARLSCERGELSEEEKQEILEGLIRYSLPVTVSGLSKEQIYDTLGKDKKVKNGKLRFILMKGLGNSFICDTVTRPEIMQALSEVIR